MSTMHPTTNQPSTPIDTKTQWQGVSVRVGYTFVNSITATPQQGSEIEQDTERHIPFETFEKYVNSAMKRAIIEKIDDGTYFSEIPDFSGVWASDENPKECLNSLDEVLRDWLLLKIKDRDRDMPVIEGINLNII